MASNSSGGFRLTADGTARALAAEDGVAAARGLMNPADAPFRQALTELIRAAGLVRRTGVNLNQAVAKLNATGHSGTSVTESVYRHEIRPALTTGATAMNKILSKKRPRTA
jgi:hypothetical protein